VTSIKDLKSDHKNARKRTDRSASLIAESLKRYGAARSIVIDEDGRILAGNGTVEGAKKAGITNVRIIEAEGDELIAVRRAGLSEDEKVGLALADNRSSDLSEWDHEMLRQLSEEHDLAPWFEDDELLAEVLDTVEGNTDPDDVPEVPEEPVTKPGDLWILGNHRLLCGDSTDVLAVERLMDGQKADMVFTDPPYGIEYQSNWRPKAEKFDVLANDDQLLDVAPIIEAFSSGWVFIWTGWKVQTKWIEKFNTFGYPTNIVIWHKPGGGMGDLEGTFSSDYEVALVWNRGAKLCGKRIGSVWTINKDGATTYVHPTQKPVALPEEALDKTTGKGAVILDLFGGSGSTLIACEKTSRHCRMMELDPAYCDVIVKRWEDFTGKKAILEEHKEAS
jgi:DNA modification methylase